MRSALCVLCSARISHTKQRVTSHLLRCWRIVSRSLRQQFAIDIGGPRVKADEKNGFNLSAVFLYFVHRDSGSTLFWEAVNPCADCRKGNASDLESVRHF